MKLASIQWGNGILASVATSTGELLIPSLAAEHGRFAAAPETVRGLLAMPNGLGSLRNLLARVEGDHSLAEKLRQQRALVPVEDAVFEAPVPDPLHFMGVGASYRQHLKEMGDVPPPANPILFLCSPKSLTGHRRAIRIPSRQPDMLDYEGELAIVIGKPCYNVEQDEALEHIAGYTIHNDISARDHVREVQDVRVPVGMLDAWGRNVAGKQHPTLSPMGPFLVTVDEVPDPHALHLRTSVNGETVQSVRTDDLLFSVTHYVSYISSWFALEPGDIISTGTPGGVGVARKPPRFLREGDVVDVEISGLGALSNRIGN